MTTHYLERKGHRDWFAVQTKNSRLGGKEDLGLNFAVARSEVDLWTCLTFLLCSSSCCGFKCYPLISMPFGQVLIFRGILLKGRQTWSPLSGFDEQFD